MSLGFLAIELMTFGLVTLTVHPPGFNSIFRRIQMFTLLDASILGQAMISLVMVARCAWLERKLKELSPDKQA